jgi:hypothetical protein
MLLACELTIRAVDGYRLFSPRLVPVANRAAMAADAAPDLTGPFLARAELQPSGVDTAWFSTSPAELPRLPMPAEMQAVFDAGHHAMFLYQWNDRLLQSIWKRGFGPDLPSGLTGPDAYWVFTPIEPSAFPRYRFPLSVTLPSGVTLNSIGFRGRDIAVRKPPRTVRIACVGASTTVDDHQVPHSYPELLEHFLRQWAALHRPDLTFEVLNAGCEGYSSTDIVQNVRHYVLPLTVDYVVYYEGANQCHDAQVLRHLRIEGGIPPKPPMPGFLDAEAAFRGENRWLYEHCATARRLQTVIAGRRLLAEPEKPPQHLVMPEGMDERSYDRTRAAEVLALGTILDDLDVIRRDVTERNAKLVLCSYRWFVHDGLELHPVQAAGVYRHLNDDYWPASYASLRRVMDLQNRWFEAWANDNGVDFLDVGASMPDDQRLHTDAIHKTALGSRCHAWVTFCLMLPLLERDLGSGAVPLACPIDAPDTHPNVPPMRRKTAAQFDAGG